MEMMEQQNKAQSNQLNPIFLNWQDNDNNVVVTPEDNDRFVLTVSEAVEACKARGNENKFGLQFNLLMRITAEWLKEHKDKISCSYLTVRDAGLLFLVVRKEISFNSDFEDLLTEFDIKIAQDPQLDLIDLSVLAIPNSNEAGISSFLKPGYTLTFRHAN